MKKSLFTLLATASLGAAALAYAAEAPKDASETPAEGAAAEAAAEPKADGKPRDYAILRLSGEEIRASEAEELWKGLFPGGSAPDFNTFDESIRQNVLRGMVSEKLIYNEAIKEGFDKSEEVQKRLDSLKKQLIMQSFMESKAKALVSEDSLKKAYQQKTSEMKSEEEVHARHILVPTEEEAKTIAKDMKKGGDFEAAAKDKSVDKGSGAQGGDLGWFTKDKMVPEFAEAAFTMKKGDVSDPVKTSFGWHVIKVEERRKVRIPSFEEMREELVAQVSNDAVQAYVENLLKKADIQYYAADGRERDFSRSIQKK